MSQQLIAKTTSTLVNRATASTTSTLTNISHLTKSSILPNPAIPIKFCPQIHTYASSYAQQCKFQSKQTQRMADNVSKIYARRMLMAASLSASSMVRKTGLESSLIPPKPTEWGTVDLIQKRKDFGESINSLGSTKISRVWAAGKFVFCHSLGFSLFCHKLAN